MLIGYARVSTEDQNLNLQRDALKKYGVEKDRIYEEHISGSKISRPELDSCLRSLRELYGSGLEHRASIHGEFGMSMRTWELIQGQLEDTFSGGNDGLVGGERLSPVIETEGAYGAYLVRTYHGSDILTCSFFEFFIETLELAVENAFRGQLSNDNKTYMPFYLSMFTIFRNFRAAEVTKNNGYPLDGFALLRDLKDRAIHLGAVVLGAIDILALHGVDADDGAKKWTEIDYKRIRRRRIAEEKLAMNLMVGSDSGLSDDDRSELERLRDLYHEEVHGSRFTYVEDLRRIAVHNRLPPFGPEPHKNNMDASMYLNRSLEVPWMVLRIFPFLQLRPRAFGEGWVAKWELLDEACRLMSEGLGDLGKPIGHVFIRFMDARFPFSPDNSFEERRPDGDD